MKSRVYDSSLTSDEDDVLSNNGIGNNKYTQQAHKTANTSFH